MYISEIMTTAPAEERSPIENKVYAKLTELDIPFERVDNDELSTMEECAAVTEVLGVDICKSILACTRNKSEYHLIIMPGDKRFESKYVSKAVGASRLSFASAEDMKELLDTTPGNASPLSVVHDEEGRVIIDIDKEIADAEWIGCNPGAATSHLKLKSRDLIEKYLPAAGHVPIIVEF